MGASRLIASMLLASGLAVSGCSSKVCTTAINVIGDDPDRTVVVRTVDGVELAGPTEIEIPTVYPNGEGCPGEALQGRFRVEPSGQIVLDD